MTRLNKVTYNAQVGTADIQTGMIWDDVYAALAPYGMNVVGGRVTGVGVAGFMLGGGMFRRGFLCNPLKLIDLQRVLLVDQPIRFGSGHCHCIRASFTEQHSCRSQKRQPSRLVLRFKGAWVLDTLFSPLDR